MITVLSTANEVMPDGSVGKMHYYIITDWTYLFAELRLKYRLANLYQKYRYSVNRFDISKYIADCPENYIATAIDGITTHRDFVEINYPIYRELMDTVQSAMSKEKSQ